LLHSKRRSELNCETLENSRVSFFNLATEAVAAAQTERNKRLAKKLAAGIIQKMPTQRQSRQRLASRFPASQRTD
jgi:hypothetical protein